MPCVQQHSQPALDLSASGTWDKVKLTLKFADYQSDGFASDTQKIWLQLDFAL